jgi:hypothetical protein
MRTRGFRTATAAALAAVLLAACSGNDTDVGGYANVGDDPADTVPADEPDEADADELDATDGQDSAEADEEQEAFAAMSDEAREALARVNLVPWVDTEPGSRHRGALEEAFERRGLDAIDLPELWDLALSETLWDPEIEHFVENLGPAEGGLWLRDADDPTSGRALHGFEFGLTDTYGVVFQVLATGFNVAEEELDERLQTWVWTYQIDPRTGEIVYRANAGEPFVNNPTLTRDEAVERYHAHEGNRLEPIDGLEGWED